MAAGDGMASCLGHGGGAGGDMLYGGGGKDVAVAGVGADIITLGGGDDVLWFSDWTHTDNMVNDFNRNGNDAIVLSNLSLKTGGVTHMQPMLRAEAASTDINARTETIFAFDSGLLTMGRTADFQSALANTLAQTGVGGDNEVATEAGARNIFVIYDGRGPKADAGVFYFDDTDNDGKVDAGELSILAFLKKVVANSLNADGQIGQPTQFTACSICGKTRTRTV